MFGRNLFIVVVFVNMCMWFFMFDVYFCRLLVSCLSWCSMWCVCVSSVLFGVVSVMFWFVWFSSFMLICFLRCLMCVLVVGIDRCVCLVLCVRLFVFVMCVKSLRLMRLKCMDWVVGGWLIIV